MDKILIDSLHFIYIICKIHDFNEIVDKHYSHCYVIIYTLYDNILNGAIISLGRSFSL